mmetsp:Transcript_30522/g.68248  ORF Transcript_30522/g.68248 Transcript_30522/m.68248 type:complete len:403 (-) Transcript_30522:74-1282(-)|eukprot:CAMPEP_0173175802 /NCGR_PEP_ID=MMETSP1141-20130122/4108_1 /TAXON_ID=483371 /ORGANISM="non described non described, Strain CCMP2298" /LENGTH=402 /DNA_ID=CAMNT_0014098073 /DNA_START=133 /DNA_END=1341 /DNA_ORIENTATION=+
MAIFPISNEVLFYTFSLILVLLITYELHDSKLLVLGDFRERSHETAARKDPGESIESDVKESEYTDTSAGQSADAPPQNTLFSSPELTVRKRSVEEMTAVTESLSGSPGNSELTVRKRSAEEMTVVTESLSGSDNEFSTTESERTAVCVPAEDEERTRRVAAKVTDPLPAGCDPFSSEADQLMLRHPAISRFDAVRYLVARKANVDAAAEMASRCLQWRHSVFPLHRENLRTAMKTGCFFPYRNARDGTPVVYMRGAYYDNRNTTAEQFVLAAAHSIEWSLRNNPDEINVTVICHTANVAGAPNLPADMAFIRLFVKVLSDNYPERLKRIILYPFPWYGRAIWSVAKCFIDARTQDKALLIADTGLDLPIELQRFVDPLDVPECCGGLCKDPMPDLLLTLDE